MTAETLVAQGRAALEAWCWEEAREAFEAALAEGEVPEALAGLGDACFWLGEIPRSLECREAAYAAYRRVGDPAWAAESAIWLAVVYASCLGNHAAGRGWLGRAEHVLGDLDVPSLRGWLSLLHLLRSTDLVEVREAVERAVAIGRECGDVDLELCALSELGVVLVQLGDTDDGLRCLDEAMAGALGGETRLFDTIVYASCSMLTACDLIADLERAAQWSRRMDAVAGGNGGPYLFAYCRLVYGRVLVMTGHWAEAERELERGIEATRDLFPAMHLRSLASLADLRIRQGRLTEAADLVDTIDDPVAAAPVEAELALHHGEPVVAVTLLERCLANAEGASHAEHGHARGELSIESAPTLGLLVRAHLHGSDVAAAVVAGEQLEAFAASSGSALVAAHAALARGRVTAARGELDLARRCLEEALERFARIDLPLETARTRLELARALADDVPGLAIAEARRALAAFERLGASHDADGAAALLRTWGVRGRTGPRQAGVLTRREQEVLRLLARGLSNQEIADELVISRKTAAHHVSNLLSKLGVRNRAEAAAHAAELEGEPRPARQAPPTPPAAPR